MPLTTAPKFTGAPRKTVASGRPADFAGGKSETRPMRTHADFAAS
jgi:hypothetical protein